MVRPEGYGPPVTSRPYGDAWAADREHTVHANASSHSAVPMHLDRFRLLEELGKQRAYCAGRSPLYVAVLGGLAADVSAAAPWVEALERAWQERRFAVGWEAVHLLLAAMHYWALKGAAEELAAVYPSCGGAGGDPGDAARAFLRRAPPEFWEHVGRAMVQTNEIDRSVAWLIAAAAAFGPRRTPFHLVELGASAGLNLIGDYLPHACRFTSEEGGSAAPPPGWDSHPQRVLTRTGLDIHPRQLGDADDRLWLKACVWADKVPQLQRLEHAIATFLRLAETAAGPVLEHCTFESAPEWLRRHRPPTGGEGLLVFNSIATVYLANVEYGALRRGMRDALAPWEGRGLWVEFERARGIPGGPLKLSAHRVMDGALQTRVLATGEARPEEMRLVGDWGYLQMR